jgi:glycosyltransferase 2 family protein
MASAENTISGNDREKVLKWFTLKRILIPVMIGLAVSVFLIIRDIRSGMDLMQFSSEAIFWFSLAVILQVMRDFAYMVRIRLLTDHKLSWRESFEVIMMWEFASSVTPSVVGGTAIAFFILHREGFSLGRSSSIVLVTAMLDELFYIMTVPFILLATRYSDHFIVLQDFPWNIGTKGIFLMGYGFLTFLTLAIVIGVFISPKGFKNVLTSLFSVRILNRWRPAASRMGDEIIVTSNEMRSKPWHFWVKAWLVTFWSWSSRFLVVNALIAGISPVHDHFLLYARQMIMWVILLISPTPGSSGAAEYFFPVFLGEFIQEGSPDLVALIWRLMSYYPYLIAGSLILPFWLKRTIIKQKR